MLLYTVAIVVTDSICIKFARLSCNYVCLCCANGCFCHYC